MPFRQVMEGSLTQSINNEAELRSLPAKGKLLLIILVVVDKKENVCSVNICIAKELG